jgi:hypothetical protein
MNWQETTGSSLIAQIPSIIQAIRRSTPELISRVVEAEAERERLREQLRLDQEKWCRDEDRACVRAAKEESRKDLDRIVQAWAKATNLELFFRGVQERSLELSEEDQEQVLSRLALARECLSSRDPLEVFLSWKAPQERYRSKYPSELASFADNISDDD